MGVELVGWCGWCDEEVEEVGWEMFVVVGFWECDFVGLVGGGSWVGVLGCGWLGFVGWLVVVWVKIKVLVLWRWGCWD